MRKLIVPLVFIPALAFGQTTRREAALRHGFATDRLTRIDAFSSRRWTAIGSPALSP